MKTGIFSLLALSRNLQAIPVQDSNSIISDLPSCNNVEKQLLGRFEPDIKYYEQEEILSREFSQNLDENGCFQPTDCIPEERVLIVVPYRDRQQHLNILVNNLHPMLQRQKLSYCITVAEQGDTGKFNKGLLMNAAFVETLKTNPFDCMVLHDVDMLPEDDRNFYKCSNYPGPVHLSPKISKYNYIYPYGTDFGGVTMISTQDYYRVNGHTNMFWGWGKEDADMEYRIKEAEMKINLPEPLALGRYKMLKHNHVTTWQNEAITVGIEDDRSTSLKKSLMGMKDQRFQYDGLNSLNYKIMEKEGKKLYTELLIDVRKVKTLSNEISIGGNTPLENQYQETISSQNEDLDKSCKYFEFPHSYVGAKYRYADFMPSHEIDVGACGDGCSGFSRFVGEKQNKSFAFSYPILERQENSTVYLKHCSNDLHGWQIVPKAIDIVDQDNMNVVLKFNFIKNQEDLGQLYYRDSWVYEGQRYLTNNFAIDSNNPVTTINPSNNPQIPLTDESTDDKRVNEIIMEDSEFDSSTTITVNLNSQVARGNYMVFSKIVDSFGQPIAELNWFAKLKGGILDQQEFKNINTKPVNAIREQLTDTRTGKQMVKYDLINQFKGEMKKNFKTLVKFKDVWSEETKGNVLESQKL